MKEFRGVDREFIRFIFSDNRGKMDEQDTRRVHNMPVDTGSDNRDGERMAV